MGKHLNLVTIKDLSKRKYTTCAIKDHHDPLNFYFQRSKYFLDMTNYLEWVLYVSTMLYILPFLTRTNHVWQWQAGAIAVFLAWFNCLLFLRRYILSYMASPSFEFCMTICLFEHAQAYSL